MDSFLVTCFGFKYKELSLNVKPHALMNFHSWSSKTRRYSSHLVFCMVCFICSQALESSHHFSSKLACPVLSFVVQKAKYNKLSIRATHNLSHSLNDTRGLSTEAETDIQCHFVHYYKINALCNSHKLSI